jgi:hypothetical protein
LLLSTGRDAAATGESDKPVHGGPPELGEQAGVLLARERREHAVELRTPFGDALVVIRNKGSKILGYAMHGGTAVAVVIAGLLPGS